MRRVVEMSVLSRSALGLVVGGRMRTVEDAEGRMSGRGVGFGSSAAKIASIPSSLS